MRRKQRIRQRIFENNKVELNRKEALVYLGEELNRQTKKPKFKKLRKKFDVASDYDVEKDTEIIFQDPYTVIRICGFTGIAKRRADDVPNHRIGIQVAVSNLLKNL